MIPAEFDYVAPGSLDEALSALADGGEDAKVLAGGHSLIPLMKLRLAAPSLLVDLRRVEELRGINSDGDTLRFGAMTRHHDVATGKFGLVSAAAQTIAVGQDLERSSTAAQQRLGGQEPHKCRPVESHPPVRHVTLTLLSPAGGESLPIDR